MSETEIELKQAIDTDPQPTIPGYQIIEEIHRGGQGIVYRAKRDDDEAQIAIKVLSRDEPGILAKITNTISAAGINIGSARVSAGDDAGKGAEQTFELWVQDLKTLNGVIRQIQKVKGVRTVERVRG